MLKKSYENTTIINDAECDRISKIILNFISSINLNKQGRTFYPIHLFNNGRYYKVDMSAMVDISFSTINVRVFMINKGITEYLDSTFIDYSYTRNDADVVLEIKDFIYNTIM